MSEKALIEAALFVSDKPLTLEKIAAMVKMDADEVKTYIIRLQTDYRIEDRGFELVQTPEGYELRVKQQYREQVAKLAPFADLSEGMMRTLAIIAAKQPVKQSLIVKYQGNKTYGYIANLEAKGLIKAEKYSRTKICTTTPEFEKYFGTSSEQIKAMLGKKS
jgi:segregation and condensation protein B